MTTARYRTCVALSMSARCAGVSVSCRRPATTARPSGDPCDVRMRKRTPSSIFFPVARNVAASEAVGRLGAEMARNDLRGAGRFALKYPLISEQPERHDGDLVRVVGRVHTCPKRYECKRERDQCRMQSMEPVLQHDNLLKAAHVKERSR